MLMTTNWKSLRHLEDKLLKELNDILGPEDDYGRQQARFQWLSKGERKIKFFHAWTKHKKRQRRITQHKDRNGHWCYDAK